jgi:hypothetical protein
MIAAYFRKLPVEAESLPSRALEALIVKVIVECGVA